ncbi:Outer membrane protein beta-barrel domain-containing protein [Muriicola jejuensis]|uniref:Outer membrane beta-barrel protein n=1 Tax=Muriicola jejuensis TaxID=504488 RepID=A0A6P0UHE1_9FLAO|nr:porin family protein [Muriicola jejuensis]NER09546.1 outer membrane beta-barrel protein [Muriicola jejuensis]SMP07848.1 Outer membrane protein beta-barrel domain-containing protein [Muriicola jejuensis]
MRSCIAFFLSAFCLTVMSAQDSLQQPDLKYLEDQFYVGLTYNFIANKPQGVNQRSLSYGLQFGFIKDLPLNTERNFGLGLGLGYGYNSYYTNLQVVELEDGFRYQLLDSDLGVKRNKVETHLVEVPFEIRFRNSTPSEYRFWRLYLGAKLGYVLGGRAKTVTADFKDSFYVTDIERFRYGVMANFGYNTFNIHVYYSFNNLFKDGLTLDTGEDLTFTPLRIGLIFYIL